jgi:hypothetical protein
MNEIQILSIEGDKEKCELTFCEWRVGTGLNKRIRNM